MLRPQSREKIQDLIKLKEKIEMQNKAFKKILLMKKVEQANMRKQRLLARKKAEVLKTHIGKFGASP